MISAPGYRLIRAAARLVPAPRRAEWRREWEAEAAYAWSRLRREGRATPAAALRLRLRTLTCTIDALWERKQTMTTTGLFTEMRIAARSLVRAPGFTLVALLTLALGIGANTAVFTLVDGVLFKPLPFADSHRLVRVSHQGRAGQDRLPVSAGLYVLYREQVSALDGIALHDGVAVNLAGDGDPERVDAQVVTPDFFEVMRVPPLLGRSFLREDGMPGADPVVILGEGVWRERFGADPGVLDATVIIDGTSRRVVGVVPRLTYPDADARLWLPMVIDEPNAVLGSFSSTGVARLAPGASVASALAEMQGLTSRLPELFPQDGASAFLDEVDLQPEVLPLKEAVVGDLDRTLWILLGTVGFVLLIACANVANLFLVRAEGRQRELALRAALGAGRFDVMRPFLAESLVLAILGCGLGILVASGAVGAAAALAPADLPRMSEVGIDLRVLGFTVAISLVAALLFGLFPAMRQRTDHLSDQLKDGSGRGATGGRERHRLRSGLIVAQMALALVLLVGSGLMLRSFVALRSVDPGFDPQGVLTVRLSAPTGEIASPLETEDFFRQLQDRIGAQPSVESVGRVAGIPLSGSSTFGGIDIEDHPTGPSEVPPLAHIRRAGAGYFETLDVRVVEGRTFQPGDGAVGFRAAVVSESFARKWWPGVSAVGRRVRAGSFEGWYDVVGVVADMRYGSLQGAPEEMIYFPLLVGPEEGPVATRTQDLVVRVTSDPGGILPVVRREAAALNPRIPLSNPRTMAEVMEASMARTSFTVVMLGTASLVALLLGMVGIYGVISYVVSQRTREIGVRMALGASASVVRTMVVRQGMILAALGVGVGLVAAAAMSSVMGSLLYGVSATDPVTYVGVAVALASVALAASWMPAWRASRVHPSEALRQE